MRQQQTPIRCGSEQYWRALYCWAGAIASTVAGTFCARQERDAATQSRQQSEAINRFLTEDLLYQATPEQNAREKKVTMEEVLERAAHKLDQDPELAKQPELEATLRLAIGNTYDKLGAFTEAERHLRLAVARRRIALGPMNRDTLLAQKDLAATLQIGLRRFEEAEHVSLETWQGLQRLLDAGAGQPIDLKLYRATRDVVSLYAEALAHQGELAKAVQLKRENAAAYERVFGPDDSDSIVELGNLSYLLGMRGDYPEAERVVRETLKRYTRVGLADSPDGLANANNLAGFQFYQGDAREAEPMLVELLARTVRVMGAEHPGTLSTQILLAHVLADEGRLDKAESLAKETLTVQRQVLGTNNEITARTMLILGRVLIEQKHLEEAEPLLEQARTIYREHYATKPEQIAQIENALGAIKLARHDYPHAQNLLLPGAGQLFAPNAWMSPKERRAAVGQVVELYLAINQPSEAAVWQRKLDELPNIGSNAKSQSP